MPEQRKLVSVLFVDVVGSTALGSENDPEVVRSVMARYFVRMRSIAETHGGTVEKFIGDAVMAVFGVPRAHDDDAERAVRAAVAMRDAMPSLNTELGVALAVRIGVNSGEAVAGAGEERQFLVTGDVVNVGARLQQNADAGEVVVGALTERLTRQAIEYTPREPIHAKGKTEPLAAYTALRPRSLVPDQARGLPQLRAQLVGRQRELRLLLDTYARVREERRAHLFTVVGNAGVGKSRLVGEALARVAVDTDARVLRGRCLPYGSGITYWPFIEMLREDAGVEASSQRASALGRIGRRVADLVPIERERRPLASRLHVLLGLETAGEALPDVDPTRVPSELAWAMRRYVEALARARPVVLVVDDLQWGEPPLVDAVEQIAERVREAPLFLLCVARTELLETRPGWGSGKPNTATISLDPLSPDETRTLVGRLLDIDELPDRLRSEIIARSEGNPLYCEEFLRVLMEDGTIVRDGGRWRATSAAAAVRVPESIQAVLAARLDLLAPSERRALQVASVVGERFDAREVAALDRGTDAATLDALVRKGLVLEDRDGAEATALRFKHLLIRDAAYGSLPKQDRADLHDRFGGELEREMGDRRGEVAEIVAHHAERAFAIADELRAGPEVLRPRAERALDLALALAERANERGEAPSLARWLAVAERAISAAHLGADDARAVHAATLRVEQLVTEGPLEAVDTAAEGVASLAEAAGQYRCAARALRARLQKDVWAWTGAAGAADTFDRTAGRAIALFERAGDAGGVLQVELARLEALWAAGRLAAMLDAGERLMRRADAQGARDAAARIASRLAAAALFRGDMREAERYLGVADAIVDELGRGPYPWLLNTRAREHWRRGDVMAAEELFRANGVLAQERRDTQFEIASSRGLAEVFLSAGREAESVEPLERALELSRRTGERWSRTELHALRAFVAARQGERSTAAEHLAAARATARPDDVSANIVVDEMSARVLAIDGRDDEAEALFRRAHAVALTTEYVNHHIESELALAEFLASRGRQAEAGELLAKAEARLAAAGWDVQRPARERIRAALARAEARRSTG